MAAAPAGIGRGTLGGPCGHRTRGGSACIRCPERECACGRHDQDGGAKGNGRHPARGAIRTRRAEIGNTSIAQCMRRGAPLRACAVHGLPKAAAAPRRRLHPRCRQAACPRRKGCTMPPGRMSIQGRR